MTIRSYRYLIVAGWSVLIVVLFAFRIVQIRTETREIAEEVARESFNKDYALRLWASSHGGIYVPVDDRTQPSPLLAHVPERDVQTPAGKTLTLMTPARMLKQIHREFGSLFEAKTRLSSLKPGHPETAPDEWERRALIAFQKGASEVCEVTEINGEPCLRLMRPLLTTEKCLNCHSSQGYKTGDVQGGVCVSLPMHDFIDWGGRQLRTLAASYGAIFLLGTVGILVGFSRLQRREDERDEALAAFRKANEELETRVTERTGELRALNDELRQGISERARAEEALRESETRYRRLVENAPLGIVSFGCDGQITEMNRIFTAMLGLSEDPNREPFNLFAHPAFVDSGFAEGLRHGLTLSEPTFIERNLVTKSGRHLAVRLHLAPLRDKEGSIIGVQAVVDDITDRKRAQEELRRSERRFRSLFESASEFIHVLDNDGVIVRSNPAVTAGLGYRPEELVGRNLADFIAQGSQSVFALDFPCILDDGHHRQELELVCKDGQIITVDSFCSVIHDEQGEVASFVLFQRDITDRKQAEQRIEDQNRFLNAVLESLTHPFYVIDVKSYEVLLANSAAGLSGRSGSVTCHELTHDRKTPCNTVHHLCPLEQARKTGKSLSVEHVHFDPERGPRNIEVHAYPVLDTEGKVAQVIEYSLDITERKRAEAALRESEERMRRVIESAPVGIGIVQHGRYIYVNPAFVQSFGYDDPAELVGRPPGVVCLPEDREMVVKTSRDILNTAPVSRYFEMTGIKKDGAQFEAAWWLAGIEHQGEPAILEFVTDVSVERRLRSQLLHAQKLDAIGTLAGGIAHDFNNLLQAIHGYAELALFKTKEADPGRSEFQVILQAARRAGELTQGLLTFSRQVPGKMKPVDLNREIWEVTRLLSRTIPKMIKTDVRLPHGLWVINADPAQLQQVVMNLAVNARDAMPDGGKLIIETENVALDAQFCKMHPGMQPGDYVLLSVGDNGSGMDRETRERIFEPFFSTKERGRGTGLGLSIVYGIVKSHGGAIACYSEPGEGTVFRIYLPAVADVREVEASQDCAEIPCGSETILVVDDEARLRDLAAELLSRFGYTVLTASSAREAIEIYQRDRARIGLVLLDLIMPEISGRECLRAIMRIDPSAKVIIVSGYAGNGDIAEATSRGEAKRFVRKPYETRRLLELVRQVLDEV